MNFDTINEITAALEQVQAGQRGKGSYLSAVQAPGHFAPESRLKTTVGDMVPKMMNGFETSDQALRRAEYPEYCRCKTASPWAAAVKWWRPAIWLSPRIKPSVAQPEIKLGGLPPPPQLSFPRLCPGRKPLK